MEEFIKYLNNTSWSCLSDWANKVFSSDTSNLAVLKVNLFA